MKNQHPHPLCHGGRCHTRRSDKTVPRHHAPIDTSTTQVSPDDALRHKDSLPANPTTPTERQSVAEQEVTTTNPAPESMGSR